MGYDDARRTLPLRNKDIEGNSRRLPQDDVMSKGDPNCCQMQRPRGRRRKRQRTVSTTTWLTPSRTLSISVAVLFSVISAVSANQQQQQQQENDCLQVFRQADKNRDGFLTRSEYSKAISTLSTDNSVSSHFSKLPLHLQETFDGLSQFSSVDTTIGAPCIDIIASSDYIVNTICKDFQLYGQRHLPQRKSTKLRSSMSRIDDERMHSSPSVSTARQLSLKTEDFQYVAIPRTPSMSPQRLQDNHHRSLQTMQQCFVALTIGDQDRDDRLDTEQYIRFLNQFSRLAFGGGIFTEPLPPYLQASFLKFSMGTSTIDVTGSKPNVPPTPDQSTFLEEFCNETIDLLANPPPPTPTAPIILATQSPAPPTEPEMGIDCEGTIPRQQCSTALTIADTSRDDQLDEEEFVRFVSRLNLNAPTGDTFDDLPDNVKAVYQKFSFSGGFIDISGSKPGQDPTPEEVMLLEQLCCEADLAADNPGAPFAPVPSPVMSPSTSTGPSHDEPTSGEVDCQGTIPRVQCNAFLAFADSSRDDLLDEEEYLRFINRLSRNAYADVSFDDLPGNFVQNYEKFSTTNGQIDINGAKPGQMLTPEQDEFLNALCCETSLVVANPGTRQPTSGQPPTTTTDPPMASPPSGSLPPTFRPTVCRSTLASTDFSRDDYLSKEEYVRFLNRLTLNEFFGLTYEELPGPLQSNFDDLKDPNNGEISIFGSKPGQSPSDEEEDHLDTICVSTAIALNAEPTTAPPAPPSSQAPQPSLPPTFADAVCRASIASADMNRDDYLDEMEYVLALNRLSRNQFAGQSFEDLEVPLPQIFDTLKDDDTGQINIFGSKLGQEASDEQTEFIFDICLKISLALDNLGETFPPTKAPSIAGGGPTESPGGEPTLPPGVSEVFNSFIVSNSVGLDAEQLETGADREGLNMAYGIFAEIATNELIERESSESVSRLRRRKLAVSFVNASDEIYLLVDSECPTPIVEPETCLTAFASFRVAIDSEDPDEVSDYYTSQTQALIVDGYLQQILNETDSESPLTILNASFPVKSTSSPTMVPIVTPAPNTSAPSVSFMPTIQPSTAVPTNSSMPSTQPTITPTSLPSVTPAPSDMNMTEGGDPPPTDSPVEEPTTNDGDGNVETVEAGGSGLGIIIGGAVGGIVVLGAAGYAVKKFAFGRGTRLLQPGGGGSDMKGSDKDGGSDTGRDGSGGAFGMENIFGTSPEQSKEDSKKSGVGESGLNSFGMESSKKDDDDDDEKSDDKDSDEDSKKENDTFGSPGLAWGEDDNDKKNKNNKKDTKADAFGDGNAFGMETQTGGTDGFFGGDAGGFGFGDGFASPTPGGGNDKGKSSGGGNFFGGDPVSPGWFGGGAFADEAVDVGAENNQTAPAAQDNNILDADDGPSQGSQSRGSQSYTEESYRSNEDDEGSRSHYSDEDGSYRSGDEGSQGSRSHYSGEDDTYRSGEEDTYRSGEDGGSRSYYSGEGSRSFSEGHSQRSGSFVSGEGSRSFTEGHSQRSGSYVSGEGSRSFSEGHSQRSGSYVSGKGSQGSRSFYSGQDSQGSRSYYSGEERSQGSRSYYSGEGSQGSRSYYSGEEGSQGSRSYYSGEEGSQGSRSYYSDEE